MGRYRLVWVAVVAVIVAGAAGAVTGALSAPGMTMTAALQTAAVQHARVAFFGPSLTWRLAKTGDRRIVEPGQRVTYTITLQQVQNPFSVAARMCLGRPDQAECETANTVLLSEPLVVDDLAGVTAHASFDDDAKGMPGTVVRTQDRAGSTVVTAEPDTALASVTRLRLTFSVTVNRHTRPGTTIGNTAYVSVHTAYVPAPGPLTNCPLGAVFANAAVPAACTALAVIPPAKGGAQTGFGGMAGHVGNVGQAPRSPLHQPVHQAGRRPRGRR
jgi:hypothetical protein